MPNKPPPKPAPDWNALNGFPDPPDQRLSEARFNQYAYPAPAVSTREAWEERAAWVRRRVLVTAGLAPLPTRTPLNARVWGEFGHGGVRVAKAQFESFPGFFCTGNLYLPGTLNAPAPAVLCPHGHWPSGRLHHDGRGSVPARCLMLARLGFVAFAWDMVGYNDSRQVVHRWPPAMLREAALWGVSPFGLQLWNGLRAVDFVAGLPEVDAERIGCTGASGGASQTWNLAAVEPRVKAVAPVCMLSSHYQGGCQCEEGPLLRLGDLTSLDIVGSLAPRPVMLPSVTGDWTNMNPVFEIPALRDIYRLFGAESRVCHVRFDAGHNYNRAAREHVYPFFSRHLAGQADAPERVEEPPMRPPAKSRVRIFPKVPAATEKSSREAIAALVRPIASCFETPPKTKRELAAFCRAYAGPYAEVWGAAVPSGVAVRVAGTGRKVSGADVSPRILSRRGVGDVVPALWAVPSKADEQAPVALAVHGGGKAALMGERGFSPLMAALLRAGMRVLAIDVLGVGATAKMLSKGDPRNVDDPTFYAFNPSILAMRVQDVLTALGALREFFGAKRLSLCGAGEGARVALLAAPLAGGLQSYAFDLEGVEEEASGWQGASFHPLALRVGGLRTAAALAAPAPMVLNRACKGLVQWAEEVYDAAGHPARLAVKNVKEAAFGREAAG